MGCYGLGEVNTGSQSHKEKCGAVWAMNKPLKWVRRRRATRNKRRCWMEIMKALMTQGRHKCSINPPGLYLAGSRRG